MRPPQKNRNNRHKNTRNKPMGNVQNRVHESAGPEGKVRGTPQQIIEKYMLLARDAQTSGDRVVAENFLQHAEHYIRVLNAAQAQAEDRRAQTNDAGQQDSGSQDGRGDDDGADVLSGDGQADGDFARRGGSRDRDRNREARRDDHRADGGGESDAPSRGEAAESRSGGSDALATIDVDDAAPVETPENAAETRPADADAPPRRRRRRASAKAAEDADAAPADAKSDAGETRAAKPVEPAVADEPSAG